MSIIAHLKHISPEQVREFLDDHSAAYRFILGKSLSDAKNMSQEVQAWKAKNAAILLRVIQAGKLENLNPAEKAVFEKAHLELTDIGRRRILKAVHSLPKLPVREVGLSLEKSWHGIHYLLTGIAEGGRPPLSWAVFGDRELPDVSKVMGYGPARLLTPQQTASVSKTITPFTKKKFQVRFDVETMVAARIYAVKSGEDLEYFWSYFQELRSF